MNAQEKLRLMHDAAQALRARLVALTGITLSVYVHVFDHMIAREDVDALNEAADALGYDCDEWANCAAGGFRHTGTVNVVQVTLHDSAMPHRPVEPAAASVEALEATEAG